MGTQSTGVVTASQFLTPYSDYGEYFEWEDANEKTEDRRGLFVSFSKEDKIKIGVLGKDKVLGVVTRSSGVIGNSQERNWKGCIERDIYGDPIAVYNKRYHITSICTEKKIAFTNDDLADENIDKFIANNPELSLAFITDKNIDKYTVMKESENIKNLKYIPRSQRKEWTCVGLLGQLVVREQNPGSLLPGMYVTSDENGYAVEGYDFRVLKRFSESTVLVYIGKS